MKVREIVEKLGLEVKTLSPRGETREVKGAYVGDVLSHAMANLSSSDAWVTIQTHENIVGVASLMDVACIVVCQREVPEKTLQTAEEQGVSILWSPRPVFETAGRLWVMLRDEQGVV
ncbi:MAG TPA: serine kinase [Firmicutes bacterium]|nr:serine kinase [Candidatus Fermentithermobacillaceae bacterium]